MDCLGGDVGQCQATYLQSEAVMSVLMMLPTEMLDQFPGGCWNMSSLSSVER